MTHPPFLERRIPRNPLPSVVDMGSMANVALLLAWYFMTRLSYELQLIAWRYVTGRRI